MSALCHIPVLLVPVHTHLHHSAIASIDEREHAVAIARVCAHAHARRERLPTCTLADRSRDPSAIQTLRTETHRRFVLSSFGAALPLYGHASSISAACDYYPAFLLYLPSITALERVRAAENSPSV